MEKEEFIAARTKLDKTQKEMAQLLGVSVKAIYSYEQGWRSIPTHAERQVFFLLSRKKGRARSVQTVLGNKKMCPKTTQTMPSL